MSLVSSSYLCRNSVGTYCFQRRIPLLYRQNSSGLPELIRLSLRTQSKSEAKKLARMLSVILDLNADQYFANFDAYQNSLKMLSDFLREQRRSLVFTRNFYNSQMRTDSVDKIVPSVNKCFLVDAFENFITQKKTDWKRVGGMEEAYRVYFAILKDLVGNIDVSELRKSHVIEFINAVQTIPANRMKHRKYQKKKVRELMRMNIPVTERLSPITRKRYLGQMSTFFHWLHTNDMSSVELHLPFKNVRIKTSRSIDQKKTYTREDISNLFNSEQYENGRHKKASNFWVPLIGLYTGARLNEICQLSVVDIYIDNDTGRYVFDINEDAHDDQNKSLKRWFHARLVPVHRKLIELGFIEYWEFRKSRSDKKLFPELPYVSHVNKYADRFQRWFNRTYSRQCETTDGASFHSFRHTVITHLVNDKKVDPNKIAVGFGQSPQGGVTQTTYTKRLSFKDYALYFDLIDFDDCYDSSKIKNWKMQEFSQGIR